LNFGNNILNKKSILQQFKTAVQNIAALLNVDCSAVAVSVGLVLAACVRQMYRPAYATQLITSVAILGISNIQML
jgi:hypothetical protein